MPEGIETRSGIEYEYGLRTYGLCSTPEGIETVIQRGQARDQGTICARCRRPNDQRRSVVDAIAPSDVEL